MATKAAEAATLRRGRSVLGVMTTTTDVRQLHPLFVGELTGIDLRELDDHGVDEMRALTEELFERGLRTFMSSGR